MMPNVFIEASAGTGKTQALGRHLIDLAEGGVAPQEIVALTFSRAAAGEIFERFVMLLSDDAANSADKAADILRKVLATQHLSQIGTFDSFLFRLVRAYPLELGLVGELRMLDEYESSRERSSVAFSILRRTDAKLKQAFADAFALAQNGENVRSFVDSYRKFVARWQEHVAALPDPSAWGDPRRIWGRDLALVHVGTKELALAADRVEQTFASDRQWCEFASWVRSFRGNFASKGFAKKILELENAFQGDTLEFSFSRKKICLTREETMVVRDALTCVFGYLLRKKLELAAGIYRLVSVFDKTYDMRVRRKGRLVFADVPRLLSSLSDAARLSLEFRTDSRLRAWALDEFQDTSREQWRALSNLIDEAKQSGGEKSVFIVGDRKQAIYGWRNGDVGIFAAERDSGFYENRELTKTYRSSPAIVEAVNRVFAEGRILTEFPAWRCPKHISAKPQLPGFVRVAESPGGSMEDFVEPVYRLLKANRMTTTAVLVRNNAFGQLLAERLKALGLGDVVWEGESRILDTPALSGFLDLTQLADHPGDMLTYRHFAMTPIAEAKYPGGVPSAEEVSRWMSSSCVERGLVRTFRELRALLPEDPALAWSEFTEERFSDLLHAAAEFELSVSPGTRLADFGEFLSTRRKRTVAAEGRIRIMTIHRSKGLGFDSVVLPLYEHDALVRELDGPLVGDGWILPAMDPRVARAVGGLDDAFRLRRDRAEQEAICDYYVAMTRAKQGLSIVLHPSSGKSKTLRFSNLVRSAALDDLSNRDFEFPRRKETDGDRPEGEEVRAIDPPAFRAPLRELRRRLPSQSFEDGIIAGSLFADRSRRKAMERGTALHAEMEKVEFSPELPKPEGFVELWRERPFEVFADGEWVSGRFDRVTFFRRDGELCAEIVDFKSSLRDPSRYDAQLAAYRRALAALTGIPPDRIATRLQAV